MHNQTITRAKNSTKRIVFQWEKIVNKVRSPLDLSGLTLVLYVYTRRVAGATAAPEKVAEIALVKTSQPGEAYAPITEELTGVVRQMDFEVWATDSASETYPIGDGPLNIVESLKASED